MVRGAQGCETGLFSVLGDNETREARRQFVREVKLSMDEVGVLLFADDIPEMTECEEGLSAQLLTAATGRWDLKRLD